MSNLLVKHSRTLSPAKLRESTAVLAATILLLVLRRWKSLS